MITFHIHPHAAGGYRWHAVSGNMRTAFVDQHHSDKEWTGYHALRNCVNAIHSITQHMKDGRHSIWLTGAADRQRKARKEPLWGCIPRRRNASRT